MATTAGPERPVEAAGLQSLDDATRHLAVPDPLDSSTASPSSMSANIPPPNPPFVFPVRSSPSSAPSSYSRATGRRSKPALESQDANEESTSESAERMSRSPALPDFVFNPGASLPLETNALLSPPLSPQSPRAIPSPARPGGHGHRRGGSEFVGGNIRAGDSITVAGSSPTKSDSGFGSPNFQLPLGPPPGRRTHAHRRSTAISSNDLSVILQPTSANAALRGSSAPTSPTDFDRKEGNVPPAKTLKPVESEPILKRDICSADAELDDNGPKTPQPPRAPGRARVGFSETVEFIPRPLSLISTDTSSTMTARPSHSVSGSISSIISGTISAPNESPARLTLCPSPSRDGADSRPSTAGAVLERTDTTIDLGEVRLSPRRRSSTPSLSNLPGSFDAALPTPSPTKANKRWSFFGLEPFNGSNSTARSRPTSSSSADSSSKSDKSQSSSCEHVSDSALDTAHESLSQPNRVGKKPTKKKKVKTWAGSILNRRPKHRTKKLRVQCPRAATVSHKENEEDIAAQDTSSDALGLDSLSTSESNHSPYLAPEPETETPTTPSVEDEVQYPMIDLDAALGPFNTPLPQNAEWDAAQKAAGNSKRQMHSAQGMRGFTGPGMHYHRRAESAPEMVPFEAGRFGIHRFGSSSTMADVFEEEEEEEGEAAGRERRTNSSGGKSKDASCSGDSDGELTPPALSVPSETVSEIAESSVSHGSLRSVGSGLPPGETVRPISSMRSERSTNSLRDDIIPEDQVDINFRMAVFQNASPSNSATPSRRVLAARDLTPVEISPLQLPTLSHVPISPYSMSHGSSFPSPRSPMSYDAQRISTAPSSVNDENNFQSLLMGEPGPEVRISVDDIPSLTSSNSTMTRESAFIPSSSHLSHTPFLDQRPASVSSAAFGRRRSSLASLSRLISSSHGERSKLSMEVSLDSEPDKKSRASKTKRLSRLVQFWKPKDTSPTKGN